MSWAQTMYEIQHFYNAFDLDRRVGVVEKKFPVLALEGPDGKPSGVSVEDLAPGTVWFIEEDTEE